MPHAPKILVVDDDPDIVASLSDLLMDRGYQVDAAQNGARALELTNDRCYDVALLDFKLPDIDGAALLECIRQRRPTTVVVLITAFAGEDGVRRAQTAGTWQVMRKPVDMDEVFRLLEEVLADPNRRLPIEPN